MNKLKNIWAFILLFSAVLFFACTVEPYDGPMPTSGDIVNNGSSSASGSFKVDFDGQTFIANTTQAIVNSSYVAITGMKSTGEFFQITIPSATVGTYTLSSNPSNFGLIYSLGSSNIPFLAASDSSGGFASFPNYTDTAKIIISSIDTVNKKISGTFKFTGVRFASGSSTTIETKVFTNGSFTNLAYTSDVVAPVGNTFTAKMDGVDFVSTNITGIKSSGIISVIGRKGSVENIGLAFPDNTTAGTIYNISPFGSERIQYISDGTTSGIFGGTGTITIISHDVAAKRIKGTFSASVSTLLPPIVSHNITVGTFDVTYL
ncbi:DUF6252 family protein [Flavobacterium sp.]|uniref:DUF6252 family protein n=1 Tax=Flavobacterium sp. TaxID=239 RepID=UPI003750B843